MTKQEQFLWLVQTAVLANVTHVCSRPEMVEKYRTEVSATGVHIVMDEALWASVRIPETMLVSEAAEEFCTLMLANLRDNEERSSGKKLEVPAWFARA
jgi:hypothetical protein